jgi:hypothetical protein
MNEDNEQKIQDTVANVLMASIVIGSMTVAYLIGASLCWYLWGIDILP